MNKVMDPFADPVATTTTERDLIVESTLAVGKDASLTLGQDAMIVLDDDSREQTRSFCGIRLSSTSNATRSIPYYNILSASLTNGDIVIRYAKHSSKSPKSSLYVHSLIYSLSSPPELAESWVARLLDRSYGPAQRTKRMKVLINPYGGAGRAGKHYQKYIAPIFEAAGCILDVETTRYKGHATEIAENMDITAYDVLACISGDGLPMESFNGLARKSNAGEALRKIAVVQLPCGTGNAMCWNLYGTAEPSLAALCVVKGVRMPLDLASITQLSSPETRVLSFLSQSIAIVAESDLGTENMRWMGDFRFTIGVLVRLLGKTLYPVDIAVKTEIDDKTETKRHYAREVTKRRRLDLGVHDILDKELETTTALGLPPLKYGTIADPLPEPTAALSSSQDTLTSGWTPLMSYPNLGNFYCGNMCYMAADTPFFSASLPNDGMLDLVTIDGDISRIKAVSLLLDVEGGTFMDRDVVRYRKVSCVRVVPKFGWTGAEKQNDSEQTARPKPNFMNKLLASISGGSEKEGFFSVDGEKMPFEPFQIEVHRGLGTVLSKGPIYQYEAGPSGWKEFLDEPKLVASNSS